MASGSRVGKTLGVISTRYKGCLLLLSLKNKHNLRYNRRDFSDSKPSSS